MAAQVFHNNTKPCIAGYINFDDASCAFMQWIVQCVNILVQYSSIAFAQNTAGFKRKILLNATMKFLV